MLFIAVMIAHIYIGSIGMEGAFEAMWDGTVDVNWATEHLSFPKIQSGGIRAVRQNQRIIRCDVCDHPPACNVYSRSVQVTTPA
jgi:hypothetical protein